MAREHGGAIPCVPAGDLVEVDGGAVAGPRLQSLVRAQTPQAFAAEPLLTSYEAAARAGFVGTDTSSCLEQFSTIEVHWIMGEERNLKITYPQDLFLAERELAAAGYESF